MSADNGQSPHRATPSQEAERLAEEMSGATDLQQEILEEAVASGTESGRSVCGTAANAKEPGPRSFGNVVLKGCALDNRGFMHGGGGHDLAAPRHSLLDMANIIFGFGDASMVVGASQSDMFLAPPEDQQDALVAEFRNALGVEAGSPEDVLAAIDDGTVRDPSGARQRFRAAVPGLFRRVETPHPGFFAGTVAAAPVVAGVDLGEVFARPRERSANIGAALSGAGGAMFTFTLQGVEFNLAEILVSQFVDAVVLAGFLALLGNTPRQLVRRTEEPT